MYHRLISSLSPVERRRRETINEGINELAKIVPGCEKNKGSILARAVQHINDLSARVGAGDEKRTFEKSVLEQAMQTVQNHNDRLTDVKAELEAMNNELRTQLRQKVRECNALRAKLREVGVAEPDVDEGASSAGNEDSGDGQ